MTRRARKTPTTHRDVTLSTNTSLVRNFALINLRLAGHEGLSCRLTHWLSVACACKGAVVPRADRTR